jgi:hypothetical protein
MAAAATQQTEKLHFDNSNYPESTFAENEDLTTPEKIDPTRISLAYGKRAVPKLVRTITIITNIFINMELD